MERMKLPARIETERLLLRRFAEGDRADMVRFYGDEAVMAIRKYGARPPAEASAAFDRVIAHWAEHGFGLYAVFERDGGAFCGECGLRYTDDGGEIELSYGLFAPFRGRGYASEAAGAVLAAALADPSVNTLTARSRGDNRASHRVLEKLGMRLVGRYEVEAHGHGVVKYELSRGG